MFGAKSVSNSLTNSGAHDFTIVVSVCCCCVWLNKNWLNQINFFINFIHNWTRTYEPYVRFASFRLMLYITTP
jgi:hypothetical protein